MAEGGGQLAYLTRGDTPDDGLRCHTLKVPDADEELAGRATQVGRTYEIRHDRLAAVDLGEVNEGEGKPVAEQASTHSRLGVVDDVEEALALLAVHRREDLQTAEGEAIETHVAQAVDTPKGGDVPDLVVARQLEVIEDSPSRCDRGGALLEAEALETLHTEVGGELAAVVLHSKAPVLDLEDKATVADDLVKEATARALDEHLLGLVGAEELLEVLGGTFGDDKFARRDVQQGDASHGAIAGEPDGSQIVVLLASQDIVAEHNPRGDELRDATLDELLRQLGILELVADSHTTPRANELRQIGVKGMVGEARQLYVHRRAVSSLGERDTEDLGGCYGVVAEGLVEVTDTEEQDSIGVLSLELHVLLHHRGLCDLLCHSVLVGLYSEGDRGEEGLLGVFGQDVTEEVREELPTGQAPVVDDDALDLTACSEAPVEVQDILIEDELGRTHSTAECRAVVVATAQALFIGDRYFGDEGIQAIFVHLAEVHAQALEELMSRMLHIVLVVGVVDDAL